MPTHAWKWSTQTCCATAVVPWLPHSAELGNLRHGVIQYRQRDTEGAAAKQRKLKKAKKLKYMWGSSPRHTDE